MKIEEKIKKQTIEWFSDSFALNTDYHLRLLEIWRSLPAPCRFPLETSLEEPSTLESKKISVLSNPVAEETQTANETKPASTSSSPLKPQDLDPSESMEEVAAPRRRDAIEQKPIAPALLSLEKETSSLKHYKAELKWGQYSYTVEQDLPETTTEKDWQAIVNTYETLLNSLSSSKDLHAGIDSVELSLDPKTATMNILLPMEKKDPSNATDLPRKTIAIQNEIVSRLIPYFVTSEEPSFKDSKLLLRSNASLAPTILGLQNSAQRCYLNSLIQMILATPHLREKIEKSSEFGPLVRLYEQPQKGSPTISELNTELLENRLFPGERKEQRDMLETLDRLVSILPAEEANEWKILKGTYSTYSLESSQSENEREKFAKDKQFHATDFGYTQIKEELNLPVFSLQPSPIATIPVEDAIRAQLLRFSSPHGDIPTLQSEDKQTSAELKDVFVRFEKAPQTLILHADRNSTNNYGVKALGQIALRETLNLPGPLIGKEPNENALYQLCSFSVHLERSSTNSGHYISYVKVKGSDHQTHYYELNDQARTEITQETFLEAAKNFSLAFYDLALAPENTVAPIED